MTEEEERTFTGYTGKILKVDLSEGAIDIEEPSERFYRTYLGGNGFVAYYLLKEVPKGADPLGPENRLVIAGGTLTGIPVAGSGRNSMGAKSPLTGGYGTSEVGGFFGAELRRAGFDAVVVSGRSPEPVYLWIKDGEAELRPADHLWGMKTLECQEAIREELGEKRARTALIGPAGEKQVRFACVMNDVKHAAGRTGLGAVMGSKKLKGVVASGRQAVPVADQEKVREMARWFAQHWEEMSKRLHLLGTPGGVMGLNETGALPTRNFQKGTFEKAEAISGETMTETILIDRGGCFACPIRCKRVVEIDDEDYEVDPEYGGPEYETIGAFGSVCEVGDLRAISKANELCNAYGLDTISTGMTVAFAMECFEKGLLDSEGTDGLELTFGNSEAMVEMTRRICEREGLGDLLAEGPVRAAKEIGPGAEQYAMHVKGQPLPLHECRTRHGQGLGYAVSPTGADHMHNVWDGGLESDPPGESFRSLGIYASVPQTELNPDKVRGYTLHTTWRWLANHIGQCMFVHWTRQQIVDLIKAITGWETNVWELMKVTERGLAMARAFNLREGLTPEDDTLPGRLATHHVDKTLNEAPIMPEVLEDGVQLYYGMMGWDRGTGTPTDAKLHELDLAWVRETLE